MAIKTKSQINSAINTLLGVASAIIRKANHKSLLEDIKDSYQDIIQSYTTAGRPAGTEGLIIYNTDKNHFEYYDGSQWLSFCPSETLADANYMLKVILSNGTYLIGQSTHVFDNDDELVMGGIKITGGSPAQGKKLISDNDGIGTWKSEGIIAYDNVDRSHTGDTNETIIGSPLLIPANTMGVNGHLRIDGLLFRSGAFAATFKFYLNTTNDLSGSPIQIGQVQVGATSLVNGFFRRIVNKNSLSTNNSFPATTNLSNEYAGSTSGRTAINANFAVNQYLVTTVTLADGSVTSGYDYINIFVWNP